MAWRNHPWQASNKYKAKPSVVNGVHFPSKLEGAVYSILLLREKAGEIKNIKMQVPVRLKESCDACGAGAMVYKVDFSFENVATNETVYAEAKGVRVSSYIQREKAWRKNPPAKLEVWEGSWQRPKLKEVIG